MILKFRYSNLMLPLMIFVMLSCKKLKEDLIIKPLELDPKFKDLIIKNDTMVIDGYFNKFAFDQGEKALFYSNTKIEKDSIPLAIYDVTGNFVTFINIKTKKQKMSTSLPYQNGYGYESTSTIIIPAKLSSGIYFVANKFPFLVKNSSNLKNKILVVHPSHNDIAYNNNGGMSLYFPSHQNRARILSYLRPWKFAENGNPISFYQFLADKGIKVDYICDDEMQNFNNLVGYKLIILAGHSEYWTRDARVVFDKFVDDGNNALLLTGNTMYWQSRIDFVKSQFTCYKYDAYSADKISDPKLITSRWQDTALGYNQLYSIGLNYLSYGGFSASTKLSSFNYKTMKGFSILKPDFPIFKGMGFFEGSIITHDAIEYDGANATFKANVKGEQIPVYDNSISKFYKVELLGWDYALPDGGLVNNRYNTGMCIALKKKINSGVIINMSSSNWCTEIKNRPALQTVTENAINYLLNNNDF